MALLRRRDDPHRLLVTMVGIQLGDRFVQIGCEHGARLAALAGKVGLSGRAAVVVSDESSATRARKGAEQAGVLVDLEVTPLTRLSFDDGAFDLAIIDNTAGLLGSLRAEDRVAALREVLRVLRPAGRVMVIGAAPRGGLGALLTRASSGPPFDPVPSLEAEGFRSARTLAEREGLTFVEAVKPR
jgi:ubiquinone/menaquinone biosynthesis C-methylase UbiE